jgi:hypothetical protein
MTTRRGSHREPCRATSGTSIAPPDATLTASRQPAQLASLRRWTRNVWRQPAARWAATPLLTGLALGLLSHWIYGTAAALLLVLWLAAATACLAGLLRVLRQDNSRGSTPMLLIPVVLPVRLLLLVLLLPFRPRKWIYELSSRCLICGRPLTSLRSQRARVGSTCVRTYGPRPKRVLNPSYVDWQRERGRRRPLPPGVILGLGSVQQGEMPDPQEPPRRSGAAMMGLALSAWFLVNAAFFMTAQSSVS